MERMIIAIKRKCGKTMFITQRIKRKYLVIIAVGYDRIGCVEDISLKITIANRRRRRRRLIMVDI
jgi:hypothetical protein